MELLNNIQCRYFLSAVIVHFCYSVVIINGMKASMVPLFEFICCDSTVALSHIVCSCWALTTCMLFPIDAINVFIGTHDVMIL